MPRTSIRLSPLSALAASVLLSGCGANAARTAFADRSNDLPAADLRFEHGQVRPLPADWDTCSPHAFEEKVQALASAEPFVFSTEDNEQLAAALATQGQTAVRAAVLLAHGLGQQSREILIRRLEERHDAPTRELDAGDLVAAAALAGDAEVKQRLTALVQGDQPHPDLEVRVEIARSALAAGADEVLPFLFSVIRAATPDQRIAPPNWASTTTYAWAKSRAAEALIARAGVTPRYSPDSSWADQNAAADALEAALQAQGLATRPQ